MNQRLLIAMLVAVSLVACGNRSTKKTSDSSMTQATTQVADNSTVYVYYFHGKQRCRTCVAVENVARETVSSAYADNTNVRFVEVKNYEPDNASLVEKYEVAWNALVIAKGSDYADITKEAFGSAVNSPEVLTALIKSEVDKRIAE